MSEVPTPRIILPSLLAGPLVVAFLMIAFWASDLTQPIEVDGGAVMFLILLPIASLVGVGPALVANALGTFTLIRIGSWFPLSRFPLVWGLAGGLLSWGLLRLMEFGPEWTFAYTAAGAVSALACRMRLA